MKNIYIIAMSFLALSCNYSSEKTQGQQQSEPAPALNPPTVSVIGTGKITTIADGHDVQRVNLWSSTEASREVTSYLTDGEKVNILEDKEPYYLVESANGDESKGYCMKGFVILNK